MNDIISKPLDLALKMYYQEISKSIIIGTTPESTPRVHKLTAEICNNWMKFLEKHKGKNRLLYCEQVKLMRSYETEVVGVKVVAQQDNGTRRRITYYVNLQKINNVWHFSYLSHGKKKLL